jgi:ubiquinol-cytochrome c reductase cytochrome c subunit
MRPSALAWVGALLPPAAWAAQHVTGFAVGLADCPDNAAGPGWSVPVDGVTIAIGGVAAAFAVVGGFAALAAWRASRDADDDDAPPAGRVHFLGVIGLSITPLFLAMILMSSAGAIAADGCAQAAPPSGPPVVSARSGAALFAANCARCHSVSRELQPGQIGPPLRGVGALAADFYLRTGYMPLADARDQPVRQRPRLRDPQIRSLVAYVDSFGGPAIPRVETTPAHADVAEGRELFTDHCSGCHQVAAEGGVLPGAKAPPLDKATPTQIAEAVRIGPYVMPKFPQSAISDAQLNAIIAYVGYAKHPDDAGGWSISHLGPFPEGMITWLLAIPLLLLACRAIGRARG